MDEAHQGTIHLSTFEDEARRLKVENQYMRRILDTLHKNITVRHAEPQTESKLPEVLMNDQQLVDLTTNVWKVIQKLYNLEMKLDYTYKRISQLSTMIVGGEGSEGTPSPTKNDTFTATGRKPRSNLAQTTEQSEQSLKLEKDFELITSAWMDMKGKERKIKDLEEEKKQLQEELSNKEVSVIQLKDKINRNLLTRQSHLPDRIEAAEDNLCMQKNVNAELAKKWEITEKALQQKTDEYTKLETAKKELDSKYENLKQMHREISKEKRTFEGLKNKLESDVSRLKDDVVSHQQKEINQEHKIKQLHEEKERLLTRLSIIAGDRLKHENVNIADLSDVDRPPRLSEVYSELYDNEWTDAFEELTSKGQLSAKNAIHFLLEILLNAFQKCRQITWDRYKAMKSVTITLDNMHIINSAPSSKRQERKDVQNIAESKSDQSPKVLKPVHEPPSGPSEEQQQQQMPMEPMETDDYENIWNVNDSWTLRKVGEMDVSRLHSVPTTGQSCSKDMKDSDCIAEEKKESRDLATIQLLFSVDQEIEIKKAWKTMSNIIKTKALELLHSVLIAGLEINEKDMPNLSRYLISCVEICWKMGMQERPLHLDIEAEKEDGSERVFDAEKFRTYTKHGKKVDYIVWPALFVHKGGVMLSKGIAQGC